MNRWRTSLAGAFASALAAAVASAAPAQPGQPGPVQAPYWGEALFQVYQGHTFGALTTLMASQQFGRVSPHDDEAEATRGGLLLAYGLHREAEALFAGLAERGTTPALRDKAWYYLARIRWERGLPAEAESALARVAGPLAPDLEPDRRLLAANLRLALGDPAGAATLLQGMAGGDGLQDETPDAALYAHFNLGVALIESGRREPGRADLDRLGRMPVTLPQPQERRALRDRANLTLGFDALRAGQPAEARTSLERVRLNGPFANPALLAFGWAALEDGAPRDALVPWQELLTRDPADPAVLEARLAVPHALHALKADAAAVQGYGDAIAAYATETRAIDDTIVALNGGALVDTLIGGRPGADLGWGWTAESLPADLPHRAQLAPVLATHEWQSALKDQRDLRFFIRHLGRWSRDLQSFDTMLEVRQARFAAQLPAVREGRTRADRERLAAERDALAARLDGTDDAALAQALADDGERAQQARLARVQSTLARLADAGTRDAAGLSAEQVDALRERAARAAGVLEWQLARALPERRWAARKSLRAIGTALDEAAAREAALQAAQLDEPARFAAFGGRIAALRARIASLLPQVAALQAEQQQALQAVAVRQLQGQQARLAEYTTQARFALARLQDPATQAEVSTATDAQQTAEARDAAR